MDSNARWTDIQPGTKMRIWGNERSAKVKGKKKTWLALSTSVSRKVDDEWRSVYFSVSLSKDLAKELTLSDGENHVKIRSAFITVDAWTDGTNHPAILITDAELIDDDDDDDDDDDGDDDDLPF